MEVEEEVEDLRFFTARRSLDELRCVLDLRFAASWLGTGRLSAEAEVDVEVRRIVGWKVGSGTAVAVAVADGWVGALPGSSDSGTRRRVLGSIRLEGLIAGWTDCCGRGLDRPRAAAAHDKSVDRLARRTASWARLRYERVRWRCTDCVERGSGRSVWLMSVVVVWCWGSRSPELVRLRCALFVSSGDERRRWVEG